MEKYIINGGKSLSGEIQISGSKNAALPLLFACIATGGVSKIHNVPDIGDVRVAVEILLSYGASVERCGSTLIVDTENLSYKVLDPLPIGKIRASSYLMGASLARFGRASLYPLGGCKFSSRPTDLHIHAFKALGAVVSEGEIYADELVGGEIHFPKVSVGATINAIIAASGARGTTRIYGYAREPHVMSLVSFLSSAGIHINCFDDYIELIGGKTHGAEHRVIPDMIEAGTYIAASIITESPFWILGADAKELSSFIAPLEAAGVSFEIEKDAICPHGKIKRPFKVFTAPYPGYPTDLQPIAAPLMAAFGGGIIKENVWHGRFAYLKELSSFGLVYESEGDIAAIYKSDLKAASAVATDLRGGASLVLSALRASGKSVVSSATLIERGYENMVGKLQALGASIERLA